ncbi:MAG: phosphatidate cytidylyltransferase [Gammaproteobacteria bacterium]|nr:phosphatidate cytidylyltransferase [Gammaproteobacteria bacterium]
MTGVKTRVLTGLALAAAVAAVTLGAPAGLFAALALAAAVAALLEWNRLQPGRPAGAVAVAVAAAVMAAAAAVLFFAPQKLATACLAGALLWMWLAVDLFRRHAGPAATTATVAAVTTSGARHSHSDGDNALRHLAQGAAVLWLAWCAAVWLRVEHGAGVALGALAVVWAADSGAYFAGKRFGKRRLAPAISPGKTVAGLVGGVAAAVAVAVLASMLAWAAADAAQTRWWLAAALAAALFSVVGDLYESSLKRRAGVKDSGGLLPGHGGILDRIDGLIAALPAFAVVWRFSEAAQ